MLARQFFRTKAIVAPRMVSRTMASKAFVKYNWEDPLNLEKLLTEDEIFVRDAARSYCQERLLPRVIDAYRNESKLCCLLMKHGRLFSDSIRIRP